MSVHPFVKFLTEKTANIICWQSIILNPSLNTQILDSLQICNTTENETLIDIYIATQDPQTGSIAYVCLFKQQLIRGFERKELYKDSCLYIEPGDYLVAYTSDRQHTVDFSLSYRLLHQNEVTNPTYISLEYDPETNLVEAQAEPSESSVFILSPGQIILIKGSPIFDYNGYYKVHSFADNGKFFYQISTVPIVKSVELGNCYFITRKISPEP